MQTTTRTSVLSIKAEAIDAYEGERELGLSHSEAVASASSSTGNSSMAVEEWVESARKRYDRVDHLRSQARAQDR